MGKVSFWREMIMTRLGSKGQIAVEMAVVLPILLAVVGISINLMVYLGDCARFDRVAAEAVRTQAASPGYGQYGANSRAQAVQALIEQSFFGSDYLTFTVTVSENGAGSGSGSGTGTGIGTGTGTSSGDGGVSFSLIPNQETYVCVMNYRPWGFGNSFFGIEFSGIKHTRQYVIDPFRPGVFF